MRVLITGVAGFIGSNVAQRLLEKGYDVVGIDNLSHGHIINMEEFAGHPHFTFYEDDICDPAAVTSASQGCQAIIHLAAYKIPRYSDALDTLTVNAHGSENIMKAAVEQKAKLLLASTSDVYGKNPEPPFHEKSLMMIGSPDVRRWAYAVSKMFEEQVAFAYHERFGIDIVIFRFFGGYGKNQNLTWWGGPQSVFIEAALERQEIPVHGDGTQTRSFTHVSDHVAGIVAALENPNANNLVFNLGNTQEITIDALARLIWKLIWGDEDPKITYVPYETFGKYEDVVRRIPDVSRARDVLGFQAQVDLVTGLKDTIEWQKKRREQLKAADN